MNRFYFSWMRQNASADFAVARTTSDEFVLEDERHVYDFISTSFQANFGHQHPHIVERIQEQLGTMPIASPKSTFGLKRSVSQRLVDLIDRGPGKIFYTVSGAESVENALKIARQISASPVVLARKKSYHGASLGALSVTGDWRKDPHLTFDEGTVRIPEHDEDPNLEQTEKIIRETGAGNIAAIILETISGTNGMSVPPPEWYQGIQSICRQNKIMLILDEVLVGFGRTGPAFAFHDYDLQPDLVCMSKAISGGYVPFGAIWTSPEIARFYEDKVLACGLTNYGHPLGLAALDGVLNLLDDPKFQTHKRNNEELFGRLLRNLERHSSIIQIRQRGLMAAIDLNRPAPTWREGFEAGLHFFGKENMNILAPPYVSTPERLATAMETYEKLLAN